MQMCRSSWDPSACICIQREDSSELDFMVYSLVVSFLPFLGVDSSLNMTNVMLYHQRLCSFVILESKNPRPVWVWRYFGFKHEQHVKSHSEWANRPDDQAPTVWGTLGSKEQWQSCSNVAHFLLSVLEGGAQQKISVTKKICINCSSLEELSKGLSLLKAPY